MLFNKQRFSRSLARSFYGHLSLPRPPLPSLPLSSSSFSLGPRSRLSGGAGRKEERQKSWPQVRNAPICLSAKITGSRRKSRRWRSPDIMCNKTLRHGVVTLYIERWTSRGESIDRRRDRNEIAVARGVTGTAIPVSTWPPTTLRLSALAASRCY